MLRLVLGALRRRVAQSVAVLVLTTLLCAVAAAGPLFAAAAGARAAAADLAAAPPAQRLLSVRRSVPTAGDPAAALAQFRAGVEALLPLPDAEPILGLRQTFTVTTGGFGRMAPVAYRDGVCDRLRITGACPSGPDQVVLSSRTATTLGVGAGDDLMIRAQPSAPELPLRVTGTYERLDPGGVYWADPAFGPGRIEAGEETLDPVFASRETFAGVRFNGATAVYTTLVPPRLLTGYPLRADGYDLVTPGGELLGTIAADKAAARDGALAAWVQAVLLCWLALAVVGRHTAQDRRPDVALLKLRGGTRRRILHLAAGQHLAPMLAALPPGLLLGWLGARLAAGGPVPAAELPATLRLAGWAVAVAVAAGFVILALTELPALRTPVATLLRRGAQRATGRHPWRGRVLDGLLLALAGAALFQARSAGPTGLGGAAPALVALAVTVLLARSVTVLAGRAGAAALRAGRLRAGLAALQYHRRPGIDRIFALVGVAVALLGLAAQGSLAGRTARADRAAVEVGAAEVLQVRAANRTALLWAVRQADPGGRTAMAVAADTGATPPVLAVDASRLAAITGVRFGPAAAARALPSVDGTALTLAARNDSPAPVRLVLSLEHTATGAVTTVPIGPLPPGEQELTAPLPGCSQRPGCRIVGLALAGTADVDGAPAAAPVTSSLTVRALRQEGPAATVLDAASLGDPRFWRATTAGAGLTVAARQGALTLRIPPPPVAGQRAPDNHAWVVDSAQPVPVVLAGPAPRSWADGDPTLSMFGGLDVPVRVAGSAPLLPELGARGVLVDLDTVQRAIAGTGAPGTGQAVWLAGGTSRAQVDALVNRLTAAGVEVVGTDGVARRRGRLAAHGPALADRFRLLTAGAGLLLAAVAATVALTTERRVRLHELGALRRQGLSRRDAVGAGVLGQAALLGVGLLGGLLAAVVAQRAVDAPAAPFIDDWRLVAPPDPAQPLALAAAGVLAALVLGAVSSGALLAWARGIRRTTRREEQGR